MATFAYGASCDPSLERSDSLKFFQHSRTAGVGYRVFNCGQKAVAREGNDGGMFEYGWEPT